MSALSRLTTTPFHKPSPFDVPRPVHPLSPPDTESEMMGPTQHASVPVDLGMGGDGESTVSVAPLSETAGARFRRVSTLAYVSSSRERSSQKSSRWLVVVIPPRTFLEEPGRLGHTLSSGPLSRLSSGILMPLFPTMYGQLTAIAKEFNFPSTSGLCLYLHVTESSFTFKPRISDESWQVLWSHLFEARSPAPNQQLPIGGRVEFDIDMHKARWYDSWLSTSQRGSYELPISLAPSRAASHARGDSRTTFAMTDEQTADDQLETESLTPQTRAGRHVPRKLSLLDRFDNSVRSASKVPSEVSPPKGDYLESRVTPALSPIVQEDEPKSAKKDLETRVRTWRASSTAMPTPLAATGQLSLDPANMPNIVFLDSPPAAETEFVELNLDDFAWSISSAGPGDDSELDSPVSWARVPSVHLDRRLEGSVLLTPSTATSFGPPDYDMYSVVSNISRLPSPDIGRRMLEDAPLTPSTATSWGPPLSYPSTPLSDYRAPSVDLGLRNVFSRPVTPTTATTWGQIDSYPPSPYQESYILTPDIGHRNFDPDATGPHSLVFPYYNGWQGIPWSHVWPYQVGGREEDVQTVLSEIVSSSPNQLAFPYYNPSQGYPWNLVWPYQAQAGDEQTNVPTAVEEDVQTIPSEIASSSPNQLAFPYYNPSRGYPWNLVWPYSTQVQAGEEQTEIPTAVSEVSTPNTSQFVYPYYTAEAAGPWNKVWPYGDNDRGENDTLMPTGSTQRLSRYASFVLFPPPSPLTPAVSVSGMAPETESVFVALQASYPTFNIYPAAYPHLEIYPGYPSVMEDGEKQTSVVLSAKYPAFNLYPAAYPHLEIYPGSMCAMQDSEGEILAVLPPRYPNVEIYRAVYPWNLRHIYPLHHKVVVPSKDQREHSSGYTTSDLYSATGKNLGDEDSYKSLPVGLKATYPTFDLYPVTYPEFDIYPRSSVTVFPPRAMSSPGSNGKLHYPNFDLYPRASSVNQISDAFYYKQMSVHLQATYPAFDLYRVRYPAFNIYPAVGGEMPSRSNDVSDHRLQRLSPSSPAATERPLSNKLQRGLAVQSPGPFTTVSPSAVVYPYFDLYPSALSRDRGLFSTVGSILVYPKLTIYPAVYPYFDLYPASASTDQADKQESLSRLSSRYPIMSLYPAVYPSFEIYPGVVCDGELNVGGSFSVKLIPRYPAMNLYSSVYPFFDIYLTGPSSYGTTLQSPSLRENDLKYPIIQLYSPVYPHFDLYPAASAMEGTRPARTRRGRTHAELHQIVTNASSGFLGTSPKKPSKTHLQLHNEVFSSSPTSSPTDDTVSNRSSLKSQRDSLTSQRRVSFALDTIVEGSTRPARPRSGTIHAKPNIPPVPTLPVAMRNPSRLSGLPSNPAQGRIRPPSTIETDMERKSESSSSSASPVETNRNVDGQYVSRPLGRTKSMLSPTRSVETRGLDRAQSMSDGSRRPSRIRDSLVSQRIKTFDTSTSPNRRRESQIPQRVKTMDNSSSTSSSDPSDGETITPTKVTLNSLAQFPLAPPPKIPLPPLPTTRSVSKLDRSKYPFA